MKKLVCTLLAAAVCLSLLCTGAWAAGGISINSLDDFLAFADNCTLDSYSDGLKVTLKCDIDLKDSGFETIQYFNGTLQGGGHSITGLLVTADGSRAGLFRETGPDAVISNLSVSGTVTPGGSGCSVGGIAGVNNGIIENCSFAGTVTGKEAVGGIAGLNGESAEIRGCTATGKVYAEHSAGGIAGENAGSVSNCRSSVSVNTTVPSSVSPVSINSLSALSDFDISSVSESDFLDISDAGGIAGYNSGTVSDCSNSGSVGYVYTGYNVGGIAGRSSGFISGCSNSGTILARKDAGGIAGQLEPSVSWNFSDGKLQDLKKQISSLDYVLSSVTEGAGGQTGVVTENLYALKDDAAAIRDELQKLVDQIEAAGGSTADAAEDYIHNIQDAIEGITEDDIENAVDAIADGELPELPEYEIPEYLELDTSALTKAVSLLYYDAEAFGASLQGSADMVRDSLIDVSNALSSVFDAMYEAMNGDYEIELSVTQDISLAEAAERDTGAIDSCVNTGEVRSRSNAGGIVGCMGFEVSFDAEDSLNVSQWLLSDVSRLVFAVIRNCENSGSVFTRDGCSGGIVGRSDSGAVVDSVASGSVSSQTGDCVGGIAGQMSGSISACSSRACLEGGKYVGGISGKGGNLYDCLAWSVIDKSSEFAGAVAGTTDGEVSGCFYVEKKPGGIDGTGYTGKAEPVSAEEMLAMDGAPAVFNRITVSFVFDGEVIEAQELVFGGMVESVPEVPDDGLHFWVWDDFNRGPVYSSFTVSGRYCSPSMSISSGETVPRFLADGIFYEGQVLTAVPFSPVSAPEGMTDAFTLYISDYSNPFTARMKTDDNGKLYLCRDDGSLTPVSYTRDGSYIVFPAESGQSFIMTESAESKLLLPLLISGGAVALIVVLSAALSKKKKKNKDTEKTGDDIPI